MDPQWSDPRLDELSRRVDQLASKVDHMLGDPVAESRQKRSMLVVGLASVVAGIAISTVIHLIFNI